MLAYAAIQLVGMSLYGVRQWETYADAFAVYFNLFARLSPLRWERGTLYTRPLLSGVTTLDAVPGTVALLCTMIGTTTFDGFSNGPVWSDLAQSETDVFTSIGFGQATALQLAFTVGLLAVVGLVALLYRAGAAGMRTVAPEYSTTWLARTFVHTLTPIALAYAVAHYFSVLAFQGQALAYLAANPLGHTLAPGDNGWLGTANWGINYTWLSAKAIWYVQVAALVCGHVIALALAHDRAVATFQTVYGAIVAQFSLLALMVLYTVGGLWILSQG
jgi:hypothetical protein